MTPYQARHIYGHPRDDKGAIIHTPKEEQSEFGSPVKDGFYARLRRWNVPEWRIAERWREWANAPQANGVSDG